MANAICNDEYCNPTLNREVDQTTIFGDKTLIIGGYALFAIALGALLWYEASIGIYIDSAMLSWFSTFAIEQFNSNRNDKSIF